MLILVALLKSYLRLPCSLRFLHPGFTGFLGSNPDPWTSCPQTLQLCPRDALCSPGAPRPLQPTREEENGTGTPERAQVWLSGAVLVDTQQKETSPSSPVPGRTQQRGLRLGAGGYIQPSTAGRTLPGEFYNKKGGVFLHRS